jgi:hypothetical protein
VTAPERRGIECMPGESDDDFIARIVATSGLPDPELADDLRRALPPIHRPATTAEAA